MSQDSMGIGDFVEAEIVECAPIVKEAVHRECGGPVTVEVMPLFKTHVTRLLCVKCQRVVSEDELR